MPDALKDVLDGAFGLLGRVAEEHTATLRCEEVGTLTYVGPGIARVEGLGGVKSEELLRFPGDLYGMAFNVDPDEVGVVLLDDATSLRAGCEVRRTGRVLDVGVGEALIGRTVDPLARPLDELGPVRSTERRPIEREAYAIMDRAPVRAPLQTGLKVIDALIPVGRGQRELILGDRQTGKTAIALDTIVNQADTGVLCIYCAVGKRASAVARVLGELRERGAMEYTTIVVATEEDPPGWQFIAPYAAVTMGEFFMEQGRDVLCIYDDLTRHARAYRELSLLLRRPPGREAFPGDIFYIHSRLLERSTHLDDEHGGGSLSALPIVETEAQNVSAYIPTNIISITDGQVYLSPELFQKGILPAVDVGKSVSRVGGKAQLGAYRCVAGDLRLSYSQFVELETFARFGTRLDDDTRQAIERGRRVREVLKQSRYAPLTVPEQIAILVAVNNGVLDAVPLDKVPEAEAAIQRAVTQHLDELCGRIVAGEKISDDDQKAILDTAKAAVAGMAPATEGRHPQAELEGAEEEKAILGIARAAVELMAPDEDSEPHDSTTTTSDDDEDKSNTPEGEDGNPRNPETEDSER
ncbi:alternate F1F0 ATPase, F1 subunit alpha [bacterium]|nr:alternate F1F0 ATPase, F1 subunit alpha [bacterium]